MHYVESSPEDQLQPKYSSRFYAKPGDTLDLDQPVIVDIATRKALAIDHALFPNAYELSRLEWRKDSSAVTFEYNQRGHQVYRVIEVECRHRRGAGRHLGRAEDLLHLFQQEVPPRHRPTAGRSIWMSERDGWNHLYLFDGVTGTVKNQITKGEWVVRGVSTVDEEKRQIWFSASGMYPGQDPYFVHYYRINFDGTGLTR